MPNITFHPTPDGGGPRDQDRPSKKRHFPVPPPVSVNPKTENLDRRIRSLEALGNGVFIGNVLASYMALPGLVGFWPMSSVQRSTGNAYDLSGQGRTLTYNGNPVYTFHNGLVAYCDLDGTGDFLSRASETDLSITGTETIYTAGGSRGLTLGAWFWHDTLGAVDGLVGKWTDTGNQKSYLLLSQSGIPQLAISSDGAANTQLSHTSTMTAGAWYFIAGRLTPSTQQTIWLNAEVVHDNSSIAASIFASTAAFQIGAYNAGTQPLDGRASMVFLCANSLGDDLVSSLFQTSRVIFGV